MTQAWPLNCCYNRIVDRWSERWARLHVAFFPVGALVVTWLLTVPAGAWRWNNRADLDFAGTLAPLGAFAYGTLVFVVEWSVRMIFWALAQRKKDREKMMARARAAVREEVRAAVREEVQAEVREEVQAAVREEVQAEVREKVQAAVREEVQAEVREKEKERIVQELAKRGIEVPPEIINGHSERK